MIKATLFPHQEKAKKFIISNNGKGALFFDVGCGKTLTSLAIFDAMGLKRMLVICPLSILENAWGGDIEKFTDFKYQNLRSKNTNPTAQIFLINYEACLGDKFPKLLAQIKPDLLVLDESVRIKSHDAKTTKAILKYSAFVPHRIILSGCPAPNNMMEYWSQMQFLDSQIFPRSFYAFRNTYFHLQRGNQVFQAGTFIARDKYKEIFGKGFKYEISETNRTKMMTRMTPYAVWVKKEDCLSLPEQIDVSREITLSAAEMKCYKDMKNHLVAIIDREAIAATNALSKLTKLREITSGFLIDYDGNTKGFGTAKLNELQAVLEELGNKQAIIWVNFKFEAKRIVDALGIDKCAQIHGDIKDHDTELNSFTSGAKRYLVANPASASSGLNLQNADTQIFFSLSYSYDDYYQCRGRTHRNGQKNNCVYIHLLAKDTIDDNILECLRNKEDAVDIVHKFLKGK